MICYSTWFCTSLLRRSLVWLLTIVLMLPSGCATLKQPATTYQTTLGRLAIISGAEQPQIDFSAFPQGKGEGAAKGAGIVFESCIEGFTQGGCDGDLCGASLILMFPVCGVAAVVGGVGGAVIAPSAETVKKSGTDLSIITYARAIQEPLRNEIATLALAYNMSLVSVSGERAYAAARAQDYSILASEGVDTVLEVAMMNIGIGGGGIDTPLVLYMEARVRLIRTTDNQEIFTADYSYLGEALNVKQWTANKGLRLLKAMKKGYAILGDHIYDSVFLLYPLPNQWPNLLEKPYGLKPLEPETRGKLTGSPFFMWEETNGLWPTLRWQGFPREIDIAAAPEDMGRIRDVRYDLVVAREQNLAVGEIVYRRDGLLETTHTIQEKLKANTRYFWTVRARFDLDGRERVTEWGTADNTMYRRLAAPSPWSYRFKTP